MLILRFRLGIFPILFPVFPYLFLEIVEILFLKKPEGIVREDACRDVQQKIETPLVFFVEVLLDAVSKYPAEQLGVAVNVDLNLFVVENTDSEEYFVP